MDGLVQTDGSRGSGERRRRYPVVTALLIVAIAATLLVLVQRPTVERQRALEEAVLVSEEFIAALDADDYGVVSSLVSDNAEISISPARSPQDLEMAMAWMEATGWRVNADRCTSSDRGTEEGTLRVLCRLTQENAWFRGLGLDPDTRSALTIEVMSGQIVKALQSFALISFPNESRAAFEGWLTEEHSEDMEMMYVLPALPSLSAESIELWRRHTEEFVAQVTPTPDT